MNKGREARIQECVATLEDILAEEQDYFDAMPESLQGSERGERSQEYLDSLQEAIDALQ